MLSVNSLGVTKPQCGCQLSLGVECIPSWAFTVLSSLICLFMACEAEAAAKPKESGVIPGPWSVW